MHFGEEAGNSDTCPAQRLGCIKGISLEAALISIPDLQCLRILVRLLWLIQPFCSSVRFKLFYCCKRWFPNTKSSSSLLVKQVKLMEKKNLLFLWLNSLMVLRKAFWGMPCSCISNNKISQCHSCFFILSKHCYQREDFIQTGLILSFWSSNINTFFCITPCGSDFRNQKLRALMK